MRNVWHIEDGIIGPNRGRNSQPLSLKGGKTELVIPEGVTKIDSYTFYGMKRLTSIRLPQSLKEIGSSAFEECEGLKGIELPAGVEVIRGAAFRSCTQLESICLPEGLKQLGNEVFKGCTALTALAIPAGVEKLGYGLTLECPNLTVSTVPGSHAEGWLRSENLDPTAQIDRPLQEWRKFFTISLRAKGARIGGMSIDTDVVYIPDCFGKTEVVTIDAYEFPPEMVVLCSKKIFAKLPKSVKLCTVKAFLRDDPHFTQEQRDYLADYAKKNREEILEQVIREDDVIALTKCMELGKRANAMWDAAFAKAEAARAVHCVAMLLEYKHTHLADRFKGEEFSLE